MRTQLANPTRYHVREKQKNQVKQYLSESFKSSESLHNLIPYPVLQHSSSNSNCNSMAAVASKSQPATTCNSPSFRSSLNSKFFANINGGSTGSCNNLKGGSHSAADMAHVQSLEYSSGQSTNSFPFALHHRFIAAASPSDQTSNNPMSPTISSVATSVTSASEVSRHDFHIFFRFSQTYSQ